MNLWLIEDHRALRDSLVLALRQARPDWGVQAFALAEGEVVALSGSWREQIFAISRWPTSASAEDFWYADRYQSTGIPLRIGAGKFTVHVVDEA